MRTAATRAGKLAHQSLAHRIASGHSSSYTKVRSVGSAPARSSSTTTFSSPVMHAKCNGEKHVMLSLSGLMASLSSSVAM